MSRLYGTKIDEEKWSIKELDNEDYHTYILFNKEKEEIYYIPNIIGLEQVTEDEFLIYDRYSRDDFRIARYKAINSKFHKLFEHKFRNFEFITDDRIMFLYNDNSAYSRCADIYSIKDNKCIEEAEWLKYKVVDTIKANDDSKELLLYVEDDIHSYLEKDFKVLFTVDPNTLQPNSDCYSELRDSYIKVNNKDELNKIIQEDKKYINIISNILFDEKINELKKAKEKVLVRKKDYLK